MSTLLVQELHTELVQEFRFRTSQRFIVGSFSPYLYIHGLPSGTFTFTVEKNGTEIFTHSFTAAELKTEMGLTSNYFHVFFPFLPDFPVLMERGGFTARVTASGYEYRNDSFIGWVQQFENTQNEMDYVPVTDDDRPLAMRVKIYKQGVLI